MSDDRPRRAGRTSCRESRLVLVLVCLGGLSASAVGGLLLNDLLTGDLGPPDTAWSSGAGTLLFVLVLVSALPVGLFGWSLSRSGQPLAGALVLLAVPLGAAFHIGPQPRWLEPVGVLFAPFFLASLLLSAGRGRRSLAASAAVVVGCVAIWTGALLPGALEARLREAARAGDERGVRRLLDWRVDPGGRDERGVTALMLAVEADDRRVVRDLVERGADPDLPDDAGRTAKMRSIEGRRSDLTLLFLGFAREGGRDSGQPLDRRGPGR